VGDARRGNRLIERVPEGAILDPEAILDRFLAWVADTGLQPYPAQEEALLELMTGRHVVLGTPTGSGKSLVALGLHFKAFCEGRRSFYTAPIKALVSEKFFALCEQLGPENVGMLTGDASINWAAPVICCTAEVLANMALRQGEQCDAPYVVMDEFHYYSDRDRGSAWQIPLLALPRTTFLLMSATLGNTAAIEKRIRERSGREVAHVSSEQRPVPLDFEYRESKLLETVEQLLAQGRAPIYIVHFTQRDAAEQAQGLTSGKLTSREEKRSIAAALGQFRFDTPYGKDVQRILRHGIGLHHAGLLPKYRLLVEQLSQRGLLKVICGTDTLGVGVNIPIRTVLFSQLCKFDGEKVAILPVRDFKQISGRAGRKGFDDRGSVVCQAPEHVVENLKLEQKAKAGPRKKKPVKKQAPTRGFVPWNRDTFEKLIYSPPETLSSRFQVSHGMLVNLLQRGQEQGEVGSGYRTLARLVDLCHEEPRRKRRLLREAAVLFRSLRHAEIITLEREPGHRGRRARVSEDLQRDFALHQSLSLYLVDAVGLLERDSPSYALDLLSLVEAILENPRPILDAQLRKAKQELMAQLKAERVPYEERIEKLDALTWPRPAAEFIYATFDLFREKHPWVGSENIRPKSVAREMFETYSSFEDYVRRFGIQRIEGLLLRYLSQVHGTLARTVPEAARSDEVLEITDFFRAMLVRVDSSLLEEWESLVRPRPGEPVGPPEVAARRAPRPRDLALDPRGLRSRVRAELHQLVGALSRGDLETAVACLRQDPDDPWDEERFRAALAPFLEEYQRIVFDPSARRNDLTLIVQREPRRWDVHQVLVDPLGENLWTLEGEVDLVERGDPAAPLVRLRRIGT
jgi:superfamily II DNA/RNA helicase